jgi:hypothetical protein
MIAGNLNGRVGSCLGVGAALLLGTRAAALDTCPADTDGDAIVNMVDVLNVIGNWGAGPFDPPGSDTNQDGVVDITDFLRVVGDWGLCPTPGPHLDGYSNSGCMPEGERVSPPCPGSDAFEFVVEGDRLMVTHLNTTYNCCPEDIEVTLAVDEWRLVLTEQEILVMPCPCVCCYDVESTVAGLTPGEYIVEYWWFDYETGQEEVSLHIVVVPGAPS